MSHGVRTVSPAILHISDLHAKGQQEKEPWRRRRVLGDAWARNLETLLAEEGPIHLVFFTGDAAYSGKPEEYAEATDFFLNLCEELGIGLDRLFAVPGNHDVDRSVQHGVWESMRLRLAMTTDLLGVSRWMNGIGSRPPLGFEDPWKTAILERQGGYRAWVGGQLGRPELAPEGLGYRSSVTLPGWEFPIHVAGLDTAWLCGDDADAGHLLLTENQVGRRLTDESGDALPGLRIALMHHPLHELADGPSARRILRDRADLVLRGHLHRTEVVEWIDPGRRLSRRSGFACVEAASPAAYSQRELVARAVGAGRAETPVAGALPPALEDASSSHRRSVTGCIKNSSREAALGVAGLVVASQPGERLGVCNVFTQPFEEPLDALRSAGQGIPDSHRAGARPPKTTRTVAEKTSVPCNGRRVLIAIDEFERLEDLFPGSRREFLQLMGLFRATIQHRRGVRLLVSGAAPFDELDRVWDDRFIRVRLIKLPFLDEPTSVGLLTQPVPEFPPEAIPSEVAREVYRRTGGQPYLLQVFGSLLVLLAERRKAQRGEPRRRRRGPGPRDRVGGGLLPGYVQDRARIRPRGARLSRPGARNRAAARHPTLARPALPAHSG